VEQVFASKSGARGRACPVMTQGRQVQLITSELLHEVSQHSHTLVSRSTAEFCDVEHTQWANIHTTSQAPLQNSVMQNTLSEPTLTQPRLAFHCRILWCITHSVSQYSHQLVSSSNAEFCDAEHTQWANNQTPSSRSPLQNSVMQNTLSKPKFKQPRLELHCSILWCRIYSVTACSLRSFHLFVTTSRLQSIQIRSVY